MKNDVMVKRKNAEKRDKKKGQSPQKKGAVPLNVPLRLTIKALTAYSRKQENLQKK